jgi:hypothetical protein
VKQLKEPSDHNPWIRVIKNSNQWLKYFSIFFLIYAFLNLIFSLQLGSGNEYFNTEIPFYKLRSISGFWIAFFMFSFMITRTVKKL